MDNKSLIEAICNNYRGVISLYSSKNKIFFSNLGQEDWSAHIKSIPMDIDFTGLLDKVFEAGVEKGKLDKVAEIRQSLGIV